MASMSIPWGHYDDSWRSMHNAFRTAWHAVSTQEMFAIIILPFWPLLHSCWTTFQFSSVTRSCPTLCDPMACSTPGLPVHCQHLEFTQTHVHWVSDAVQPSHSLFSPSLPAFNLSQHQGLFKWVSASTSVLPKNTQDLNPLGWTGWISLQSKGLSRVFSNTTVQKHQFCSTQLSL